MKPKPQPKDSVRFRRELTANDGAPVLTLSANELAIDDAGSHSMAIGSR